MKSNKSVLKRIMKQLKRYKLWFALTLFLAVLTVAGTLVVPILFGKIINLLDLTKVDAINFKELYKLFIIIGAIVGFTCLTQ